MVKSTFPLGYFFPLAECLLVPLLALYAGCANDSGMEPEFVQRELNVEWIQRLPEIDYVEGSTNPTREGWPQEEQEVTWRARVKNWSGESVRGIEYGWILDGAVVASGTVDIPAASHVTVDYPWHWTFERHELEFVIDPGEGVIETKTNNRLMVYTDALTIGFYLEQGFYEFFKHRWVDWVQKEVSRWNSMLDNAIYPETPNGALDRVRIDKMVIIPNAS